MKLRLSLSVCILLFISIYFVFSAYQNNKLIDLRLKSDSLILNGEYAEAIMRLREAIRIRPDLASSHYKLGVALLNSGQLDSAVSEFNSAIDLTSQDYPAAYYELGNTYIKLNKTELARVAWREAIRSNDGIWKNKANEQMSKYK